MDKNTWAMRQLWNTKEGYYHGIVTEPIKLKSSEIKLKGPTVYKPNTHLVVYDNSMLRLNEIL